MQRMKPIQFILALVLGSAPSILGQTYDSFANYFIKWTFKDQNLPILLNKKINPDSNYRWFKYSENIFIDEIADKQETYISSNTNDEAYLHILDYNYDTQSELSSYAPVLMDDTIEEPDETDLFTLVYFKSHLIDVIDFGDNLNVYCNASFLMPSNKENVNKINLRLIERHYNFKIGFSNQINSYGTTKHTHSKKYKTILKNSLRSLRKKRNEPSQTAIEINLSLGPIVLPKTHIFDENDAKENRIFCKMDLLELDMQEFVLVNSATIYKEVDTYAPRSVPDKTKSEQDTTKTNKPKAITTAVPVPKRTEKITSSENNANSLVLNSNYFSLLLVFVCLKNLAININ